MEKDRDASALRAAADFLRRFGLQALAVSAGLLIPCFWHRRIEAGDLGSHVYNAWLAQLIGKGQAPGLYIAKQWNNVLFDVALLRAANLVGMAAAQKIVVSACVLIFFWGVFAFVAAITERINWGFTESVTLLLRVRDSFLDLFAWRWISISGGAAVLPGKHSNCRSNCTR